MSLEFLHRLINKPISALAAFLALFTTIYSLYRWSTGAIYVEQLNYIDYTTLIMVSVLILRGIKKLDQEQDLVTFSTTLLIAISFVFCYEAIYKLSFYLHTLKIPPEELRELIIYVGITMVVLAGFAYKKFKLSQVSIFFTSLFVLGWLTWLVVGFPQLINLQAYYTPMVEIPLNWQTVYIINRGTKIALCLVYFNIYV
jgi:hypothetical protein